MITLKESGVVFHEETHTYSLNGKKLQGITGMIERQLFPHKLDNIPESVLKKAAELGSAIHKACQMYDEIGIEDQMPQVAVYKKLLDKEFPNSQVIANEYIVTDGEYFASPIDKVIQITENTVAIVDVKTTYELDKEYVSWQTSIYKYLFEKQNPGIKVGGLLALWLPKNENQLGKAGFFFVDDKGSDAVVALMEAEKNGEQYVAAVTKTEEEHHIILAENAINEMLEAERLMGHYKNIYEKYKQEALDAMLKYGVKSFDSEKVKMTLVPGGKSMRFDSTRFKKEQPDLYAQYLKESETKDSIRVTVRE